MNHKQLVKAHNIHKQLLLIITWPVLVLYILSTILNIYKHSDACCQLTKPNYICALAVQHHKNCNQFINLCYSLWGLTLNTQRSFIRNNSFIKNNTNYTVQLHKSRLFLISSSISWIWTNAYWPLYKSQRCKLMRYESLDMYQQNFPFKFAIAIIFVAKLIL